MYLSSLYFLYANIHSPQICQRKIHQCQGLVCQCCDHVTCFLKEPRGMKLGFHDLHSEDLNILQLSDVRMLNNCFECKVVSDLETCMGYL